MIDPESLEELQRELRERIEADRAVLDDLRAEVRKGLGDVRRIQPRATTAISLVGTDGGNNRVEFDPFLAQLVRVVDSSNNEHALEVVTPSTDIEKLSRKHRPPGSAATSALGKMMEYLGVEMLWDLSPVIARPPRQSSPSWVQVYRELTEWAVLFKLVRERDYGTDTLVVFDGLLRSKMFKGTPEPLFAKLAVGLREAIEAHAKKKRRVFVVGVAKHSKVLDRFRLAMMLEKTLRTDYAAFAEVGRDLEKSAYRWGEYARGSDDVGDGEANKGDNWFIFHLLSSADLQNVRRANAHFSEDLLSSLLNEPIPGQGVFWSSVGERPYPVSVRILSFERMFKTLDPQYNGAAVENYAAKLRTNGGGAESAALRPKSQPPAAADLDEDEEIGGEPATTETAPSVDLLRSETDAAVAAVVNDSEVRNKILTGDGFPWGVVMGKMQNALPASLRQDKQRINKLIARAIDQIVGGAQNVAWHTEQRPKKAGGTTLFIIRGAKA